MMILLHVILSELKAGVGGGGVSCFQQVRAGVELDKKYSWNLNSPIAAAFSLWLPAL